MRFLKSVESAPGIRSGLRDFGKSFSARTFSAAIIASIFGCSGPVLVCMAAAQSAGFTPSEVTSWVCSVYICGGLLGILLSLRYKIPISGAWTIPGATMLSSSLVGFSFNEAAGAFIITGIIVLILGLTGAIGFVMKYLPLPIVMAMIAGCMLRFGTGIVTNTKLEPVLGFAAIFGYFVVPKLIKRFPPALSALICGVAALLITHPIDLGGVDIHYMGPMLVKPAFNPSTIMSVSIPLAALVVGAENAQAMGVLMAQGYKVPCNAMTVYSGLGCIVTGLFGGASANIAGPMTAICSSEDAGMDKSKRYAASAMNGVCFVLAGTFMGYFLVLANLIPKALIGVIAGLAMVTVLIGAFQGAFKTGLCRYGAFIALVIGVSDITIFSIGAPFWALLGGVAISIICEREDLRTLAEQKKAELERCRLAPECV